MRSVVVGLALCSLAVVARPLTAQEAGTEVGGSVIVKVYVTHARDAQPSAPVASQRLVFYRSATDSTPAETNGAGLVTVLLRVGDYRMVTGTSKDTRGATYRWDQELSVRPGMGVVYLTARNAIVNGVAAAEPTVVDASPAAAAPLATAAAATAEPVPSVPSPRDVTTTPSPGANRKDPTLAGVLSFLVTGVGQMYAGETGKGVGLLVTSVVGTVVMAAGLQSSAVCDIEGCESGSADAAIAVGLGAVLVPWIYGIVDAPKAAHRYNQRTGFESRVGAVIAPGAGGSTRVGLSIALGR